MLSIGIFTYSTRPRGSVVHALCLAEALIQRGHDVTLYALSKQGDALFREAQCPVVLFPAQAAATEPDALIRQRIGEVAAGLGASRPRHDVYHAEDCLVAGGLLEARSALRLAPIVRTLHHWEHFESAYLRACQRRSLLEADAIACVSRSSQRDVARELGRRCAIIGNGVDVPRFERRDLEREQALRGSLGIGAADPVVLSVGGVEPRKNSLLALEAMARVLRENTRLFYVIAGGASIWEHAAYRNEFQARLVQLQPALRARVLELGSVAEADLTTLYGLSDVLLCPSMREGFGLCVLEALAAKCAVVVSEGEPFSEYLDASTASFVPPQSAPAISEAVRQLLASPELRAERMAAGSRRASEYSWQRVAAAHERWYDELLSRRDEARSAAQKEAIHA